MRIKLWLPLAMALAGPGCGPTAGNGQAGAFVAVDAVATPADTDGFAAAADAQPVADVTQPTPDDSLVDAVSRARDCARTSGP